MYQIILLKNNTLHHKLIEHLLFSFCHEDEIYRRVNKDNIASQKVMLNNGAHLVSEDESHYFMRIPK